MGNRTTGKMRPTLTRRQRQILDFFQAYTAEHNVSPTLEEIAHHFEVTKVTIFGHVAELERKGVLVRSAPGISRGLQIVPDGDGIAESHGNSRRSSSGVGPSEGSETDSLQTTNTALSSSSHPPLHILGTIAAGSPIEAVEEPEIFELHDIVPRGAEVYVLRVSGDSMIEDAIRDGDLVLVERRESARNGETVVAALPDGDVTLKRFYREAAPNGARGSAKKDRIRLQPANNTMEPIFVDDVEIRGVVVGVVRRY